MMTVKNFEEDHKKTLELYPELIHLALNKLGLDSLKNLPTLKKLQIVSIKIY